MRKTLLLAWREYKVAVRGKAFVIMLVLVPVMFCGGIITIRLFKDRVDTTDRQIAVIDRSGVVGDALAAAVRQRNASELHDPKGGRKTKPAYEFELVAPNDQAPAAQRLELSNRIRRNELAAFVEIGADVLRPRRDPANARISYYAENAAIDDARRWIVWPINDELRMRRATAAGIDAEQARELFAWIPVEPLGLLRVDAATGEIEEAQRSNEGRAIGVPIGAMLLMLMMIMVGATPLANAVLEEKMQRIAEVLLGAVRPFQLMAGKLLGTLAVSLTVISIYLAAGIALALKADVLDYVPLGMLPWFFTYMVAAILFFGSLLLAFGAVCSDVKEAQSVMVPLWLLVMIPMFVWLPVVKAPTSEFATVMSLIPPFTPILMLLRQVTSVTLPAWQPWVGLVGLVALTSVCVWMAGRVYRVGILMQGKPPRLGTIVRWAVRG